MAMMLMMSRALPLGTTGLFGALSILLLLYCCSIENAFIPIVVASPVPAANTGNDDGGNVLLPQYLENDSFPRIFPHHQQQQQQPRLNKRPNKRKPRRKSSVPSVEVDCATRHFAWEFAIQKLPWSSPSQRQHISDALRLHECPLRLSSTNQELQQKSQGQKITLADERKEGSSMAQILRGRRTEEYSNTKDDASFPEQQQDTPFDEYDDEEEFNDEEIIRRIFVDPSRGNDEASGSEAHPKKTIPAALSFSRELRSSWSNTTNSGHTAINTTATESIFIVLRGGRYHLEEPLRLDSRDSHLIIVAFNGEIPILSGGDPLSLTLVRNPENPCLYSAKLPLRPPKGSSSYSNYNYSYNYNFTMLFLDRSKFKDGDNDFRLVWAREPNGHPERDLQPDGYATANGTDSKAWPDKEGAVHFVIGKNDDGKYSRNSSIYPWHGEDRDPRGGNGNWLVFGGTGNRFVGGKGYWNGTVPMGLKFQRSTLNTSGWTSEGYAPAIAHVFHNGFWGNWQFEVDSVATNDDGDNDDNDDGDGSKHGTPRDGKISFKRGGWQEGRGGGIKHQPFFIEGVKEALDVPGEWWLDVPNQVLHYYPFGNETTSASNRSRNSEFQEEPLQIDFMAPRLQRLIEVVGENSGDRTANGITIIGLTFAHTATTFMEPYEVPSPGDWSIHRGGAVFLENARDTTIEECVFLRTGGNAVVVSGHAKRSYIAKNDFAWIGDSAIITLGKIPMADGFTVDTYPEDTIIKSNHFREIGIHGKQTSALFSALSCKTTFQDNVLYNGPRAGINLNDQFCHGHTIRDNLLFNWVRETQDHGPINTWNRAMYIQRGDLGTEDGSASMNPTLIPRWTHIEQNFIMNGPSGNRDLGNLFPTIDNDDGSSYFYISKNLLVYGGGKNYLGHDKLWTSNLLVYPGRWSGESCAQIWSGKNHYFAENTCLVAPGDPPIGLDGSIEGFHCKIDWEDSENLKFVGKTANNSYYIDRNDQWGFGCGNGTSPDHWFSLEELQKHGWELGSTVRDSKLLTADGIIDLAKKLLAMG